MKSEKLLKEFAIDPECFPTFEEFRRILENVGIAYGRYISDLPRENWLGIVRNILTSRFPDRSQEIERELQNLRRANGLIPTRCSMGPTWVESVITEQSTRPFDALVTTNALVEDRVEPEHLSTRSGPWQVESSSRVPKTAKEIMKLVSSLFFASREIKLIDPYFHPRKDRYLEFLQELAREAAQCRSSFDRFEYHCQIDHKFIETRRQSDPSFGVPDWATDFETKCYQRIPRIMPTGFRLKVVLWDRNVVGEAMHSRYIMSELAAIKVDYGLDEGDAEKSTDIDLVSQVVHQSRWDDFRVNARTYKLVKVIDIEGLSEKRFSSGGSKCDR